jgi:hypothetical protein
MVHGAFEASESTNMNIFAMASTLVSRDIPSACQPLRQLCSYGTI